MNLSFFIARRYLFSKKKTNAVNLITGISIFGVAVGTAAMIVVLSAFNGMEGLIRSFYSKFDPDIKVEIVRGKSFDADAVDFEGLYAINGVEQISQILEEKVLLQYREKEYIATVKGVDSLFRKVTQFEESIQVGRHFAYGGRDQVAVIGTGVAYHLSLNSPLDQNIITAFVPRPGVQDPLNAFTEQRFTPVGTFSVQPEYNDKFVIVPLSFARKLLRSPSAISSLEIKVSPEVPVEEIQSQIAAIMGDNFTVKNRDEQQEVLFKVMQSEGLITYFVLSFIMAIASFSILGSLTMLILEKREDLKTLKSFGATRSFLRRIFFLEGSLITGMGLGLGLILGIGIYYLQKEVGLIILGQGYVVEAYPVDLYPTDIVQVALTVMVIGLGITAVAVRKVGNPASS
ncbi:MAG: FtsX-like permease family protein [Schleiferiaceae bacterium]